MKKLEGRGNYVFVDVVILVLSVTSSNMNFIDWCLKKGCKFT